MTAKGAVLPPVPTWKEVLKTHAAFSIPPLLYRKNRPPGGSLFCFILRRKPGAGRFTGAVPGQEKDGISRLNRGKADKTATVCKKGQPVGLPAPVARPVKRQLTCPNQAPSFGRASSSTPKEPSKTSTSSIRISRIRPASPTA